MLIGRRGLILRGAALLAAPAIVKYSNLMPVRDYSRTLSPINAGTVLLQYADEAGFDRTLTLQIPYDSLGTRLKTFATLPTDCSIIKRCTYISDGIGRNSELPAVRLGTL